VERFNYEPLVVPEKAHVTVVLWCADARRCCWPPHQPKEARVRSPGGCIGRRSAGTPPDNAATGNTPASAPAASCPALSSGAGSIQRKHFVVPGMILSRVQSSAAIWVRLSYRVSGTLGQTMSQVVRRAHQRSQARREQSRKRFCRAQAAGRKGPRWKPCRDRSRVDRSTAFLQLPHRPGRVVHRDGRNVAVSGNRRRSLNA